jgi:predicted RNase H-like nuclease (RuvC/YqgF family)
MIVDMTIAVAATIVSVIAIANVAVSLVGTIVVVMTSVDATRAVTTVMRDVVTTMTTTTSSHRIIVGIDIGAFVSHFVLYLKFPSVQSTSI